jgi:hypothetical protein
MITRRVRQCCQPFSQVNDPPRRRSSNNAILTSMQARSNLKLPVSPYQNLLAHRIPLNQSPLSTTRHNSPISIAALKSP